MQGKTEYQSKTIELTWIFTPISDTTPSIGLKHYRKKLCL